jgi:hypothetical protein
MLILGCIKAVEKKFQICLDIGEVLSVLLSLIPCIDRLRNGQGDKSFRRNLPLSFQRKFIAGAMEKETFSLVDPCVFWLFTLVWWEEDFRSAYEIPTT